MLNGRKPVSYIDDFFGTVSQEITVKLLVPRIVLSLSIPVVSNSSKHTVPNYFVDMVFKKKPSLENTLYNPPRYYLPF